MLSVHAIMVPTVALTPPPDQAEANWLLRVTSLPLFLCLSLPFFPSLSVSQWSTFWTSRGSAMSFHALKWPWVSNTPWGQFTISRHNACETAICMHSMSRVISYLGRKRAPLVGSLWVKSSSSIFMQRVAVAGSSCPVRSSPITPWSKAGQRLLGSLRGGWGMVKQRGNSVADEQWATSCYDSVCACQDWTVCTFGTTIWGLCKTSSTREVIMGAWHLIK